MEATLPLPLTPGAHPADATPRSRPVLTHVTVQGEHADVELASPNSSPRLDPLRHRRLCLASSTDDTSTSPRAAAAPRDEPQRATELPCRLREAEVGLSGGGREQPPGSLAAEEKLL
ncbi:unnamed protein product [Urochloa humidicola]